MVAGALANLEDITLIAKASFMVQVSRTVAGLGSSAYCSRWLFHCNRVLLKPTFLGNYVRNTKRTVLFQLSTFYYYFTLQVGLVGVLKWESVSSEHPLSYFISLKEVEEFLLITLIKASRLVAVRS